MVFGSNIRWVGLKQYDLLFQQCPKWWASIPSPNSPFNNFEAENEYFSPHFLHIQFSASGVAQHFPVWNVFSTQKLAFHHLGWDPIFFPQKTWKMPLLRKMKNLIKSFFLENHIHPQKHTLNLNNFVGLCQNLIFFSKGARKSWYEERKKPRKTLNSKDEECHWISQTEELSRQTIWWVFSKILFFFTRNWKKSKYR